MRTALTAKLMTAALAAALALSACNSGSASGDRASAAASSLRADPVASADLAQAKADAARCITGTPLQQVHTIHVVLLEKESPAVKSARAQVFGCMGVPPAQQTAFKNDALAAAEKGRVYTKAGAKTYVEVTLPALLNTFQHPAAAASPGPSASSK